MAGAAHRGAALAANSGRMDARGTRKRAETDIDKLLGTRANLVFCRTPFNKIVGDLSSKALHGIVGPAPTANCLNFTQDFLGGLWQRLVSH